MSLIAELTAALSVGAVVVEAAGLEAARSDASGTGAHLPIAVLRPRDVDEVSTALRICSRYGQGVVPQGGMTGLAGGGNPGPGDIALSLARLDQIEAIDAQAGCMTLGAGVILQTAQEAAERAGFLFPVDLGARGSARIGGMIATNAGGVRVIRHGMMRENLLGIEAVLADGTVISHLNTSAKDNTGYALTQLLAGSEGSLAVITRAVIRLRPLPRARLTALCALARFEDVLALLALVRGGLPGLSAFEAMWQGYFALNQEAEGLRLFGQAPAFAVILESESDGSDAAGFEALLGVGLERGILQDALIAQSDKEARAFWSVREGYHTERLMPGMLNLDISLPTGSMGDYAEAVRLGLKAEYPTARVEFFGHIGDGNLHIALQPPDISGKDVHGVEKVAYDVLRRFGGSVSAEHGIGTLKRPWLHYSRSDAEIAAMRRIKAALDPIGILNIGKVLPQDADKLD